MRYFKKGDKVKIKENLSVGMRNVTESMIKYKGKIATIRRVRPDGNDWSKYVIDLDREYCTWGNNMFETIPSIDPLYKIY